MIGITKHGAIFLVSRLGQPLLIHAVGKEINMGPALYLTIHPLIIVRGKSLNQSNNVSLGSTIENEEPLKQRYSLRTHPTLPIFVCSDGYLICVLKLQPAFATQSRLIRELMHETIGLLNSVAETTNSNYKLSSVFTQNVEERKRKVSFSAEVINEEDPEIPDWGLNTHVTVQSEKSSDSGVESNGKGVSDNGAAFKVAEGKIIFSYLPQILPISMETFRASSVVDKMEMSYELLQSSWALLASMETALALRNTHECDQTAKTIQQTFAHFVHLFLSLDPSSVQSLQVNILFRYHRY